MNMQDMVEQFNVFLQTGGTFEAQASRQLIALGRQGVSYICLISLQKPLKRPDLFLIYVVRLHGAVQAPI